MKYFKIQNKSFSNKAYSSSLFKKLCLINKKKLSKNIDLFTNLNTPINSKSISNKNINHVSYDYTNVNIYKNNKILSKDNYLKTKNNLVVVINQILYKLKNEITNSPDFRLNDLKKEAKVRHFLNNIFNEILNTLNTNTKKNLNNNLKKDKDFCLLVDDKNEFENYTFNFIKEVFCDAFKFDPGLEGNLFKHTNIIIRDFEEEYAESEKERMDFIEQKSANILASNIKSSTANNELESIYGIEYSTDKLVQRDNDNFINSDAFDDIDRLVNCLENDKQPKIVKDYYLNIHYTQEENKTYSTLYNKYIREVNIGNYDNSKETNNIDNEINSLSNMKKGRENSEIKGYLNNLL